MECGFLRKTKIVPQVRPGEQWEYELLPLIQQNAATYANLKQESKYTVDKSLFLKDLLSEGGKFLSICLPHQMGKTMVLTMIESFFAPSKLTKSASAQEVSNEKIPVLYFPLGRMWGGTLEDVLDSFRNELQRTCEKFKFIGEEYENRYGGFRGLFSRPKSFDEIIQKNQMRFMKSALCGGEELGKLDLTSTSDFGNSVRVRGTSSRMRDSNNTMNGNGSSANAYISGNGNGNKLNRRIEMLENLLRAAGGDGTSAKTNSLRHALRCNKSDMADDTTKSLDVLRQVFQSDLNEEIKQVIDRYLRTTFTPAFENLKRNGHDVTDADISKLCVAILDGAKSAFLPEIDEQQQQQDASEDGPGGKRRKCVPACTALLHHNTPAFGAAAADETVSKLYESDENESDAISLASYNSSLLNMPTGIGAFSADAQMKRRGRPKKMDMDSGRSGTPVLNGRAPISMAEAIKWNPSRFTAPDTRFVLASKVNRLLGFSSRSAAGHIFAVHPRAFRVAADEEDRAWLLQRNLTKRISGKLFMMALQDALEMADAEGADLQVRNDLQRYAFVLPERMLQKMRVKMVVPFEQLRSRVLPGAGGSQPEEGTAQMQPPTSFLPAFQI